MTSENIRNALDSGKRFMIRMADGKEYQVPHPDFVAFTRKRTSLVFWDEDDRMHVLPLITMTGLSYLEPVEMDY